MGWGVNDMQQTLDMGGIEPPVTARTQPLLSTFLYMYECLIFKVKERLNVLFLLKLTLLL